MKKELTVKVERRFSDGRIMYGSLYLDNEFITPIFFDTYEEIKEESMFNYRLLIGSALVMCVDNVIDEVSKLYEDSDKN